MISPECTFKKTWNILIFILLIYTAVLTPIRISFKDESAYWLYLELTTDILFMSDIVVNFLSAYSDKNGVIVFTKRKISKNYLKSWFIIDFVSSFPL